MQKMVKNKQNVRWKNAHKFFGLKNKKQWCKKQIFGVNMYTIWCKIIPLIGYIFFEIMGIILSLLSCSPLLIIRILEIG